MKILVPLNNAELLQKYIDAGADEFYIGFHDLQWSEKFGKYADINRMSGFGMNANRYSFEEILRIAKRIKINNKSVFITLNANTYSEEQIDYILREYVPGFLETNVDGVIVSDLALAKKMLNLGVNPVASTMCSIYNSDIGNYYVANGVQRIILPRDISLAEIESISQNIYNSKIEVFFMRNGCVFSDGYCLGMHRPECGATCGMIRNHSRNIITNKSDFKSKHDIAVNNKIYDRLFHNEACAMCALYRMQKIGVYSLKIVGRADNPLSVCQDIITTKKNIKIAENAKNETEYLERMIYPFDSLEKCNMGLSCYYPEIRF